MSTIRDTQRSKLYRAERVVNGEKFADMEEMRKYVNKITRSDWWKKHHENPAWGVAVTDGRRRRNACAVGSWEIRMPRWSRCERIVLHELAHTVVTSRFGDDMAAWHGCEFAKILLSIVKRFMGKEAHDTMKASFKEHRVHYTTSKI